MYSLCRLFYSWEVSAKASTSKIGSQQPTRIPAYLCSKLLARKSRLLSLHSLFVCLYLARWSAVCRGATLWGLEQFGRRFSHTNSSTSISQKPMIVSRLARCSYGLVVREPFDPRIHKDHEKVHDRVENVWMAPNRMHWLLCRVSTSSSPLV